jgi:hypothetical protein
MVICSVYDHDILMVLHRAACFIQIDVQNAIFIRCSAEFGIGIVRQIDGPGYILTSKTMMMVTGLIDCVRVFFITNN